MSRAAFIITIVSLCTVIMAIPTSYIILRQKGALTEEMVKYEIKEWNDDSDLKRADKAQFAIRFELKEDCFIEVWAIHTHAFFYSREHSLTEKVVSERLRAGNTTVVVDIDDYVNRHYDIAVLVYTCETGNTIAENYDNPADELDGMMMVVKEE